MPNPDTAESTESGIATTPPDGVYEVDPEGSRLLFRAKAFALAWVRGTIPVAGGTIRIADGRASGAGELTADRITTGLAPRDWHLRSSHYLHTAKHPRIRVSVGQRPRRGRLTPVHGGRAWGLLYHSVRDWRRRVHQGRPARGRTPPARPDRLPDAVSDRGGVAPRPLGPQHPSDEAAQWLTATTALMRSTDNGYQITGADHLS